MIRSVVLLCSLVVWIEREAANTWIGSFVGGNRSAMLLHRM